MPTIYEFGSLPSLPVEIQPSVVEELSSKITVLEVKLRGAEGEVQRRVRQVHELQGQLNATEAELHEKNQRILELEALKCGGTSGEKASSQDILQLQLRVVQLEEELDAEKRRADRVALDSINNNFQDSNVVIRVLKAQLNDTFAELGTVREQKTQAVVRAKELADAAATKDEQIRAMKIRLRESEQDCNTFHEEIEYLEQKLKNLTCSHAKVTEEKTMEITNLMHTVQTLNADLAQAHAKIADVQALLGSARTAAAPRDTPTPSDDASTNTGSSETEKPNHSAIKPILKRTTSPSASVSFRNPEVSCTAQPRTRSSSNSLEPCGVNGGSISLGYLRMPAHAQPGNGHIGSSGGSLHRSTPSSSPSASRRTTSPSSSIRRGSVNSSNSNTSFGNNTSSMPDGASNVPSGPFSSFAASTYTENLDGRKPRSAHRAHHGGSGVGNASLQPATTGTASGPTSGTPTTGRRQPSPSASHKLPGALAAATAAFVSSAAAHTAEQQQQQQQMDQQTPNTSLNTSTIKEEPSRVQRSPLRRADNTIGGSILRFYRPSSDPVNRSMDGGNALNTQHYHSSAAAAAAVSWGSGKTALDTHPSTAATLDGGGAARRSRSQGLTAATATQFPEYWGLSGQPANGVMPMDPKPHAQTNNSYNTNTISGSNTARVSSHRWMDDVMQRDRSVNNVGGSKVARPLFVPI